MDWIYIILVGALAGWIGSFLFKGSGSGLIWNVLLGVTGAIVGGWLFEKLDIQVSGFSGSVLTAAIGAFVVLWIYRLIGGGRRK
ncbi:MAG: GlsB/YeaQ/YmgE family stress response membrane protein [Saprospiraceae bacterium]|nr:GlsB/YeaQ/YmgE family stress response membrane protein [Saprospiraceae bacterium]